MKLLIVFVSALVLVTQGAVLTAEEMERGYDAQYMDAPAGQPVYMADVGPSAGEQAGPGQSVYAVDASAPAGVRLFGAEDGQRAAFSQDQEPGVPFDRAGSVYIPILTRTCTNSLCAYICNVLGFENGSCVSTTTCQCSNLVAPNK